MNLVKVEASDFCQNLFAQWQAQNVTSIVCWNQIDSNIFTVPADTSTCTAVNLCLLLQLASTWRLLQRRLPMLR